MCFFDDCVLDPSIGRDPLIYIEGGGLISIGNNSRS